MIRTEKRMRVSFWLIIFLLCFIWGNSLLPGKISGAFSDWVKGILAGIFGGAPGRQGSGLLRKIAHFSEFAALGACLFWRRSMKGGGPAGALAWGFGVACVDETIQRFVPDRGPSLRDVGIDTCGVLAGITVLYFGHLFIQKKRKPNLEDN